LDNPLHNPQKNLAQFNTKRVNLKGQLKMNKSIVIVISTSELDIGRKIQTDMLHTHSQDCQKQVKQNKKISIVSSL
jgi:hypothetical protein